MIIDYIAMNNPDDIMPYKTYKSGVIEGEKGFYTHSYPPVNYPILNLQFILEDFEGNSIVPGHYQISLSSDRKTLYFVESNKIKASVPVAKLIEKMVNEQEEREKLKEQEKLEKKYRKNPRKRPVDQTQRKIQADMEASIDDRNAEYYILHYKNGNIQADAYIIK